MQKVFIATPTMSGDVCHEYVVSILGLIGYLASRGIHSELKFLPGSCYLAFARNELVADFLSSDCTHLLFIDADLGFPSDGAYKLLQADKNIVCGLYPYKKLPEDYPGWVAMNPDKTPVVNREGLVEMRMTPTGFMMIKRDVFQIMIDAYPQRRLGKIKDGIKHDVYNLFATEQSDGRWWGEDAFFCKLWSEIGGQMWAVPDMEFKHVGKTAYSGNWHEFMLRQPGGSISTTVCQRCNNVHPVGQAMCAEAA